MSAAWTDDRVDLLKQLWEKGTSASLIADALAGGITRNAVIGKAHRLGLKARPSPVKNEGTDIDKPKKATTKSAAPVAPESPAAMASTAPRTQATAPRSPTAPAKPPAAKTAKVAQSVKRIGLLELSEKICKWPIGHPGDEDFHFCGKPVNASTPYCAEHGAIAYQSQLPRKDRRPPLPPIGGRFRT